MKKPTHRWANWQLHRISNQRKRDLSARRRKMARIHRARARVWTGDELVEATVRRAPRLAPKILCLDQNPKETLELLDSLRRRLLASVSKKGSNWLTKSGDAVKVPTYIDFRPIEYISTAVALVLAAEYDRARIITGQTPPLFDLGEWNPEVFERLLQLGFFHAVGMAKIEKGNHAIVNEDVMTLRFVSGSDAAETSQADLMLLELAKFIDPQNELPDEIAVPMNSALSEAMVNVRMHAYPSDHRFQYRQIGRWWLSGAADRAKRVLSIAIYDQGATIPITYDRLPKAQAVLKFIKDNLPQTHKSPYANDAVHIEAAMKYGNSKTGKPNQGKGLPQMIEAINAAGLGQLLVFSRGGRYLYKNGSVVERAGLTRSIGGTLIEWTIEIPRKDHSDE